MTIAHGSAPLPASAHPDAAQVLGPADAYVARILNLVGTHAHAIHAMLTVSRVEWSREVATACVECQERPRLLLNPEFVQRWCHTPERLAALILHELMHIALGHTRLYPQPTAIHNIAFDAIINRSVLDAIMAGGANVHAYAAMFTDFYAANASPAFLLRPPPGWPLTPDWQASHGQPEPLRFAIQLAQASQQPFDAKKISVPMRGGPLGQERAVAATQFHLEGLLAGKERGDGEGIHP